MKEVYFYGSGGKIESDGKTIVVSSDSYNGDGTDRGRVKVYQLLNNNSDWTQLGGNIDGIAGSLIPPHILLSLA